MTSCFACHDSSKKSLRSLSSTSTRSRWGTGVTSPRRAFGSCCREKSRRRATPPLSKEPFMTVIVDRDTLYHDIVEASPIAILYADRDGKIVLWNAGAEAMFGFTAAEVVGQSMDFIIPEKQRPR